MVLIIISLTFVSMSMVLIKISLTVYVIQKAPFKIISSSFKGLSLNGNYLICISISDQLDQVLFFLYTFWYAATILYIGLFCISKVKFHIQWGDMSHKSRNAVAVSSENWDKSPLCSGWKQRDKSPTVFCRRLVCGDLSHVATCLSAV